MRKKLEDTLSKTSSLNREACEDLFSFDVPKISAEMDGLLHKEISPKELEIALRQLNSKASPGIDGIPSTLYVKGAGDLRRYGSRKKFFPDFSLNFH